MIRPGTVDWTKPIEAVRKSDGHTVPMILECCDQEGDYRTVEAPDPDTTNSHWRPDGTDCCVAQRWFIRNREPRMTTNNTENAMGGVWDLAEAGAIWQSALDAASGKSIAFKPKADRRAVEAIAAVLSEVRIAARQAALEEMERACTAAQYSPHPYSDLKQAIRKMRDTPPATNTEG